MYTLVACPGQRCGVQHHVPGSAAARQCLQHSGASASAAVAAPVLATSSTPTEHLFIEASIVERSTDGVRWRLELESATSEAPVSVEYLGLPQQPTEEEVLTHLQVHHTDVVQQLGLQQQVFTPEQMAQHCIEMDTQDIAALASVHGLDSDELFKAVMDAEDAATPMSMKDLMDRRHQQNLQALANVAEPESGESPWQHYGLRGPQELRSGASMHDPAIRALDAIDQKESDAWARQLSHPEHTAIWQYCGGDYHSINEALRDGSEMYQVEEELVQRLDSALAKAPIGTPRVIYRGFSVPDGKRAQGWAQETFPVGDEVTFDSFLSTSRDVSTATRFAQNSEDGIVLEILTGQGVSVSAISRHGDGERERLLPRGLSMKVVGVHHKVPFSSYGSIPKPWTVVQLVEISALEDQP